MCVSNGNQAEIHEVLFENINVEFQSDTQHEVLQREDGQQYDPQGRTMPPCVIRNMVEPYAIRTANAEGIVRKKSEKFGDIHDVTYRNIYIYTDDAAMKPIIAMKTPNTEKNLRNFRLEKVYLNGEKVKDLSPFETVFENVENVTVDGVRIQ